MFGDKPKKKVPYCYNIYQELLDRMEKKYTYIAFHKGLPSEQTVTDFANDSHNMIVLDDLAHHVQLS